jgi:PPOX class probable F420-dependent enzyme
MAQLADATARTSPFPAEMLRFLQAPGRHATLATINEDGSPHQARVWYRLTDEGFIVNSKAGRRWCENLRRDARIAVAVADGHDWVGFRGTAAFLDDGERAQQDIAAMARAYHRDEPGKADELIAREFRHQRRVSFLLTPADVHVEIGDQ